MASRLFLSLFLAFGILIPQTAAQAPQIVYEVSDIAIQSPKTGPGIELVTKSEIAAYALKLDQEGGFKGEFYGTMAHESMGWQNVQSRYYKNGVQEPSFGICQIHLPSHPDITKEQTLDPKWCLDWSYQQFKLGNQWMWSSWKLLYK